MSTEPEQPIDPTWGYSPEGWEKPTIDWVTIVLIHDEDEMLLHQVLTAAGVVWSGIGSHGIFYCEVAAADREEALRSIRGEPRLEGRYVDMERVPDDQCYKELFRIPSRSPSWLTLV